MKKSFTITSILGLCVFFFSNFVDKPVKTFVISMVTEEPVLPSEPFAYSDITIPEHLVATAVDTIIGAEGDTIIVIGGEGEGGYSPGGVDPRALDFLEDDKATLGRVLFYDKKLSALENISCASCHHQSLSFTENKSFSEGISALTRRNSMHLNDLGWSNNEMFFWDMSESDLSTMIRLPLTDENEIGANMDDINIKLSTTIYYPDLFKKAFGTSTVDEERIVEALVHFISSMNTFNSRLDQESKNNFEGFTEQEMHGLEVFSTNCATCHTQGNHDPFGGGEILIDPMFEENILEFFPFIFNNMLPEDHDDHGAGEWNEAFDNLFKIPSLRNIELTGPYMHDGRFNTLEEVIDHYSDEVVSNEWSFLIPDDGFRFDENEKKALVAFMKTFTDESFLTDEKWSDPFLQSNSIPTLEFEDLVIKPNPMENRAIIEFNNDDAQLVSMNIYAPDGKLMQHKKTTESNFILDKENFIQGMYLIEMIMGDRRSTSKLMVR